jgi:hypothetical protein
MFETCPHDIKWYEPFVVAFVAGAQWYWIHPAIILEKIRCWVAYQVSHDHETKLDDGITIVLLECA